MQKVYVLIDIGGTAIKHGIATIDGTLQERGELPTEAQEHGGPGIVAKVKDICKQAIEKPTTRASTTKKSSKTSLTCHARSKTTSTARP